MNGQLWQEVLKANWTAVLKWRRVAAGDGESTAGGTPADCAAVIGHLESHRDVKSAVHGQIVVQSCGRVTSPQ